MKAEESFPIQPLSLEDFPKLDFDVYIRIADKFILYFRRGEFVDEARLDRLIQKKLKQLFLAKSYEAKYRQGLSAHLDEILKKSFEPDLPLLLQAHNVLYSLTFDIMRAPSDPFLFQIFRKGVEAYIEMLPKVKKALKAVLSIKNYGR
ncbi:MAG: hypothetical protein KDD22_03400, partial [Bdellovibrionales bacterium]|nr:hypothetical protein [Bdellovibrionales bacterium]